MKLKFTVAFLALILFGLFASCDSLLFPSQKRYEKVYNGMTIKAFLKEHKKARNEYMSGRVTVYSIRYMNPMDSRPYRKFYYFIDGSLFRVDMGERAVDYRIKID